MSDKTRDGAIAAIRRRTYIDVASRWFRRGQIMELSVAGVSPSEIAARLLPHWVNRVLRNENADAR